MRANEKRLSSQKTRAALPTVLLVGALLCPLQHMEVLPRDSHQPRDSGIPPRQKASRAQEAQVTSNVPCRHGKIIRFFLPVDSHMAPQSPAAGRPAGTGSRQTEHPTGTGNISETTDSKTCKLLVL